MSGKNCLRGRKQGVDYPKCVIVKQKVLADKTFCEERHFSNDPSEVGFLDLIIKSLPGYIQNLFSSLKEKGSNLREMLDLKCL